MVVLGCLAVAVSCFMAKLAAGSWGGWGGCFSSAKGDLALEATGVARGTAVLACPTLLQVL